MHWQGAGQTATSGDAVSATATIERIGDGQKCLPGLEGLGAIAVVAVPGTRTRICEDRMSYGPERTVRKKPQRSQRSPRGKKESLRDLGVLGG
ncbi:MAG: hypothetical protein ACLQNE_30130 [Thermoguttaceae bacterium]